MIAQCGDLDMMPTPVCPWDLLAPVQSRSASPTPERIIQWGKSEYPGRKSRSSVRLPASSNARQPWTPPKSRHDEKGPEERSKKQKHEAGADSANQSRGAHYAEEAPRGESRGPVRTSHDASDTGNPAEPRLKKLPLTSFEPRGADVEEAADRADDYNADEADYEQKAPDDESEEVNDERGDDDHEAPDHANRDRNNDDDAPRLEESRKSCEIERDDGAPTTPTASSSEAGRVQRTDPPE